MSVATYPTGGQPATDINEPRQTAAGHRPHGAATASESGRTAVMMPFPTVRMSVTDAIPSPSLCLLVLIGIMAIEGGFTFDMREVWLGQDITREPTPTAYMTKEIAHG